MSAGGTELSRPDASVVLYIDYRGYITVQQVQSLLAAVDTAYESLFYAESPQLIDEVTHGPQSRLRARRLETGNSLTVEFFAGVQQVVQSMDPTLAGVGGGVAILGLTTRVLISSFRHYSLVHHQHKTQAIARRDEENRVRFHEFTGRLLERTLTDAALSGGTGEVARMARQISEPVSKAAEALNHSNIVRASLAGESLKSEPGPNSDSPPGSESDQNED